MKLRIEKEVYKLGDRIREAVDATKGIHTVIACAKAMGVNRSALYAFMDEKPASVSLEHVNKLEGFLGVKILDDDPLDKVKALCEKMLAEDAPTPGFDSGYEEGRTSMAEQILELIGGETK